MKFFLPLFLAALVTLPVRTEGAIYLGVFYNLALKSTLRSQFYSTKVLGTADDSSRVPAYDHTTIYFDPPQSVLSNQFNARFGATQTAHILGYAMDEHAQALLLSYDGPNAIQTQNSFPHVTISSSNTGPYSAVYSNDLWVRIAASGFVTITNDAYGKPATIKWNLKNPAIKPNLIIENTYQFTLPKYNNYASTLVKIKLYQPSLGGILKGIFCASSQWNGKTGECNTTPIGPVAKPTCPATLCQSHECEFGCEIDIVTCTEKCKEPSIGETVRTVSFRLSYTPPRGTKDVDTVILLANAMRKVADTADIPRSDYIINNSDFVRVSGQVNSKDGKWAIKIGFRAIDHPDGDERQIFIEQLKLTYKPTSITFNSINPFDGISIEEDEQVIEATEFYLIQTCEDGRTLGAEKQCAAAVISIEEAAAPSSSSSSIPIVTIIAPIIGGIVLLALIATAFIIRHRRTNTINAIKGIEHETVEMELNPAVTMTEADRV